ncbi:Lrp/AsnC family transcriptional regulator [Paeniglutamicibacter kerguelensis]|uniref:DNA-binding Lrp family transcriptional regulator n=1 Tax=Paeniglutamicibacter kerguelensis TaxID=254788 RepID=A0ABS4XJF9_9MICC|nr:Lrp/AsnC family transcriptional regulator [Paeniglutamicibacter kerguelensis]MBP2388604.1 DNA-binding Lrp family transcriptional regulator [Paeniglutamicibacter kerguelensis]
MISELDLEIVNALQVNPRADWARVADALGLSAPTVARHWNVLAEQGLAWITPAPGPRYPSVGWSAFIYVSSVPAELDAIVSRLCAEPAFGTVSLVSGSHDLFIDCFASSHEALMDILSGAFADLPGVIQREIVFITKLYRQAAEWRSGTLEPGRAQLVAASRQPPQPEFQPDGLDALLLEELARDGRATWAEMGAACMVSPQTAKRRLERFLAAGYMALRCDTSMDFQQGMREVTLVLNVPATHVDAVGRYFSELPNCRLSAQVLGAQNLVVTLWVRDYLEVQGHERELATRAPGSTVISRQAVIRYYKRLGHLLDEAGRNRGLVPLPLWRGE